MGLIETLSRRKGSETKKGGGKRFIAGGIKAKPSKELAPNPQSGPTFLGFGLMKSFHFSLFPSFFNCLRENSNIFG